MSGSEVSGCVCVKTSRSSRPRVDLKAAVLLATPTALRRESAARHTEVVFQRYRRRLSMRSSFAQTTWGFGKNKQKTRAFLR